MQAEQTLISLRPGGGANRGHRFVGPRFDSSSASSTTSENSFLRPHGGVSSSFSLKV